MRASPAGREFERQAVPVACKRASGIFQMSLVTRDERKRDLTGRADPHKWPAVLAEDWALGVWIGYGRGILLGFRIRGLILLDSS